MTWQTRVGLLCATIVAGPSAALAEFPRLAAPATTERPASFTQPVVIRLTESWFTSRIDRPIDEQSPVDEVILGHRVRGTARTVGQPQVQLCEDPDDASLRVVMTGTTVSRTVGHSGPVTVRSRSETTFTATKQIVFTPGKGFAALPAVIQASTRVATEDVQTSRRRLIGRIVQRRAWREINANRPQVTEIARRRATVRIGEALDRQVDEMLVQLNRSADLRETIAMLRGPGDEPRYCCRSTNKFVEIAIGGARGDRSPLPPALGDYESPVQVWFHKSLVPPAIAPAMARFQSLQTSFEDILGRLERGVPLVSAFLQPTASQSRPVLNYQVVDDWTVLSWHDSRPAVSIADFGSRTLR
jgi:hypothetical protein